MFKVILVAVDGSEHAKRALHVACDMSKRYGAALHLIHTPQLDTTALALDAGIHVGDPGLEQIREAGEVVISDAKAAAQSGGVTPASAMVSEIGSFSVADGVVERAKAVNADVIVMGRRGLGGVGSFFLGSVSQKVAHESPCACLTVH